MRWIDNTPNKDMAMLIDFCLDHLTQDWNKCRKIKLSLAQSYYGKVSEPSKTRPYYMIYCRLKPVVYPFLIERPIRPLFITRYERLHQYDKEMAEDTLDNMAFLLGQQIWVYRFKIGQIKGKFSVHKMNEFGFKFLRRFKEWRNVY